MNNRPKDKNTFNKKPGSGKRPQNKKKIPFELTYYSLNRNVDDDSVHLQIRYKGRLVGGRLEELPAGNGYKAGRFTLYRNDWPNLVRFIRAYIKNNIFGKVCSGDKHQEVRLLDEEFEQLRIDMIKNHKNEIKEYMDLFRTGG